MADYAPMLISIPPRYAVSQVVGFIKGKSAIHIERDYFGRKKNFTWQHFWSRDPHVSTVGRDAEAIREYIKEPEREDRRIDQVSLFRQIAATFKVDDGFQPLGAVPIFEATGMTGGL